MPSEPIHLGVLENQCTVEYTPSTRPESDSSLFNPVTWFTTEEPEPDTYRIIQPDGTVRESINAPFPRNADYPEMTVRTFIEQYRWESLSVSGLLLGYGEYGFAEQYPSETADGNPFVCVVETDLWRDRNHGSYVGVYAVDGCLMPFVIVDDELTALPESDIQSRLTFSIEEEGSIVDVVRDLLGRGVIPTYSRSEEVHGDWGVVYSAQVGEAYASKMGGSEYYVQDGVPTTYRQAESF